jgi:integrase/recombinase XerC
MQQTTTTVESIYEAVNFFEYVGMLERKLSRRTRREYRKDLDDFIEFLESQAVFVIGEISLAHLRGFQIALDRAGCKQSTVRRKSFAVKVFFSFLASSGVTAEDRGAEFIPLPQPGDEIRFLSTEERQRLLSVCSKSVRDTAIIRLFLHTGIRLSEAVALGVSDVTLDEAASVRVRRRTGAVDTISLTDQATTTALQHWLSARPSVSVDALFLSRHGKPLSKRAVQFLIAGHLQQAGIAGASVHTLRHTMAVHHAAQGMDAESIQEILGLSSLRQAEQYVSASTKGVFLR